LVGVADLVVEVGRSRVLLGFYGVYREDLRDATVLPRVKLIVAFEGI
jgi:hypothetical protein